MQRKVQSMWLKDILPLMIIVCQIQGCHYQQKYPDGRRQLHASRPLQASTVNFQWAGNRRTDPEAVRCLLFLPLTNDGRYHLHLLCDLRTLKGHGEGTLTQSLPRTLGRASVGTTRLLQLECQWWMSSSLIYLGLRLGPLMSSQHLLSLCLRWWQTHIMEKDNWIF